jgi:hypothetical protein
MAVVARQQDPAAMLATASQGILQCCAQCQWPVHACGMLIRAQALLLTIQLLYVPVLVAARVGE